MSNRVLVPLFVLLWASGYVVGDLAIQAAGPMPLLASRMALSALVTLPFALRGGALRRAPVRRLIVIGLLLQVTQFGGAYTGFALGVPAGVSALVILGCAPLLTTGLAIAGGHERGDRRVWLGLTIGLGGVAIGVIPSLHGAHLGLGLVFTAISLLGLAGGTVLQKRWNPNVEPLVSVAVQSMTGAAVFIPAALIVGGRYDVSAKLIGTVLWLGLGMGIGALIVLVTLISRMHASRVGTLLLLVPAVTAIASWPVLGESLHPLTFVGMAVAAIGVGTVLLRQPAGDGGAGASVPARARPLTGMVKICPGQPSTSNVSVGSKP
jgi:drug/metabolite transporter (DMT)-like permease